MNNLMKCLVALKVILVVVLLVYIFKTASIPVGIFATWVAIKTAEYDTALFNLLIERKLKK